MWIKRIVKAFSHLVLHLLINASVLQALCAHS